MRGRRLLVHCGLVLATLLVTSSAQAAFVTFVLANPANANEVALVGEQIFAIGEASSITNSLSETSAPSRSTDSLAGLAIRPSRLLEASG